MTLPFVPPGDIGDLLIEIDRRISNVEGKIGSGLSHKDLIDIEDHLTFLKQDGSVPVTGTLDFTKAGEIKNARNRVLNVDIYGGPVRLDVPSNQFIADPTGIQHDLLLNLLWSVAGHIIDTALLPDSDGARDIGSLTLGWKDLYLTGVLYFDDTNALTHDGTTFTFNGAVTIADGLDVNLLATDNITIDGATDERGVTVGAVRQLHTPGITGTRAYNIVINANNQADTKGITIEYVAKGLSGGDTNAGIDVTIDTSDSTGGEIDGLHVSTVGSGGIKAAVIHANSGVLPVRQDSGTVVDIESAWENAVEYTTEFKTAGGANDVELFPNNGAVVYVGVAATFSDIVVVLAIAAGNPGVKPTFEFSAGAGSWTVFGASDGTNGFRVNGAINWSVSDLLTLGWVTDTVNGVANKYWIRITRTTAASVSPLPKESLIRVVASTRYEWDENGDLNVNSVSLGFTSGSVVFSDGSKLTEDNSNLFWDDSLNKLTVGGKVKLLGSGPYIQVTEGATNVFEVYDGLALFRGTTGGVIVIDPHPANSTIKFASVNGVIQVDNLNKTLKLRHLTGFNSAGTFLTTTCTAKNTSGEHVHCLINPTYNQSGATGSNVDLEVDRIETLVSSGLQYSQTWGVGGVRKAFLTTLGELGLGTTPSEKLHVIGNIFIDTDSNKLILGAGKDMDMYYDGTDGHLRTDVVAASDLKLDCGAQKTLELQTTIWDDIYIPLAGARVPAANAPTWSTYSTNLNSYTFDIDDYTDLASVEIKHGYKEGTDLEAHVHIITNGSDVDDRTVKFTLFHDWGDPDEVMDGEASLTGEITIPGGTASKTHFYIELGTVTGTNHVLGSLFKCRLKRIASTGTEPTNDPFVEMIGVHYERDTFGSRQENTK